MMNDTMSCNTTCSLSNLSRGYFHEMDRVCGNDASNGTSGFQSLVPAMLFTQLVRLSVSVTVLLLLATLYNMISVMDRLILSSATCSLYWILMVLTMILKSILLMVLVPVQWKKYKSTVGDDAIETVGFLVMAFLQSLATLLLFLALDHERQFRSSDYATVDRPTKHCIALSCNRKLLLSWPRLVGVVLTCIPIGLLIAIEIVYAEKGSTYSLGGYNQILIWAYIFTLPLTRLAAVGMGVAVMVRRSSKLSPTVMACVYLSIGLVLSLMEDLPNFVTSNTFNSTNYECLLKKLSIFDILQLIGVLSSVFFLFFVRSQYLRVEQESKLNLVWDLQKLLQVDGRKDIVRHKQYT